MEFLSKLNTRYATKVFDSTKKIPEQDLANLLEAIRLSASSFGLQPYRVLVVEDPAIRKELRKVAWDQSQITDASALLVFAVKYGTDGTTVDEFVDLVSDTRNVTKESLAAYGNMMKGSIHTQSLEQIETWVSKQAYIALGFGLVSAAVMGIDSCPMEGFNPSAFDKILDINKIGLKSKVLLAVGYRSSKDGYQQLAKVRQKKQDLFITY